MNKQFETPTKLEKTQADPGTVVRKNGFSITFLSLNTVKGLLGLQGDPGEKGNLGNPGPQVGYFNNKMGK